MNKSNPVTLGYSPKHFCDGSSLKCLPDQDVKHMMICCCTAAPPSPGEQHHSTYWFAQTIGGWCWQGLQVPILLNQACIGWQGSSDGAWKSRAGVPNQPRRRRAATGVELWNIFAEQDWKGKTMSSEMKMQFGWFIYNSNNAALGVDRQLFTYPQASIIWSYSILTLKIHNFLLSDSAGGH